MLPSFTVEALKQHRLRQLGAMLTASPAWQDHDYVFCTSIGTHLNPTMQEEAMRKIDEALGG